MIIASHHKAALMAFCLADSKKHGEHTANFNWASSLWASLPVHHGTLKQAQGLKQSLDYLMAPLLSLNPLPKSSSLLASLHKVHHRLLEHKHDKHTALSKVNADIMPPSIVFAFLDDHDEEVASCLVQSLHFSHRHPRSLAACAFYVGLLRAFLGKTTIRLEKALIEAEHFALCALQAYQPFCASDMLAYMGEAKHALHYSKALLSQHKNPDEFAFPQGIDGRDSPEHILTFALLLALQKSFPLRDAISLIYKSQEAADVIAPLYASFYGAIHGLSPQLEADFIRTKSFPHYAAFLHTVLMQIPCPLAPIAPLEEALFDTQCKALERLLGQRKNQDQLTLF